MTFSERYAVKITLYSGFHAQEVVYYRYALPLRMVTKWRWYFEYLQALIKICFPREFVELSIEPQSVLCGVDYIEKKSESLLKYKRARLKRECDKVVNDDLFGYTSAIKKQKIESLTNEIDQLENGVFEYYVPVTYINKVKSLLKPHDV